MILFSLLTYISPASGPSVVFGSGGSLVEVLKDSWLALPPFTPEHATYMIAKTRIGKVIEHKAAAQVPHVAALIARLGVLVAQHPEIKEIGPCHTTSPHTPPLLIMVRH